MRILKRSLAIVIIPFRLSLLPSTSCQLIGTCNHSQTAILPDSMSFMCTSILYNVWHAWHVHLGDGNKQVLGNAKHFDIECPATNMNARENLPQTKHYERGEKGRGRGSWQRSGTRTKRERGRGRKQRRGKERQKVMKNKETKDNEEERDESVKNECAISEKRQS